MKEATIWRNISQILQVGSHINFKCWNIGLGENLKTHKRKEHSYLQRSSHRLLADFSKETLQARRGWREVFEVMKGKDLHPRLL